MHKIVHNREKPFPCNHCNKRFSSKVNLESHGKVCTGKKPFPCNHCNLVLLIWTAYTYTYLIISSIYYCYEYTFLCVIKSLFPHSLFKAALACLHVPATSLPAERIFSLAGYAVRDRRTKLLPDNVNKLIFLHQNIHVIHEVPAPDFQRH